MAVNVELRDTNVKLKLCLHWEEHKQVVQNQIISKEPAFIFTFGGAYIIINVLEG